MATKLCDKYDIKDRVEIVADVGTSVATLPTHFAVGSKAYIGSQAYMLNASNTWVEDNTGGGGGGGSSQLATDIATIPAGGGSGYSKFIMFTAQQANSTIALNSVGSWGGSDWTIKYTNGSAEWADYVFGTTITLANVGDYVCFAGAGNESKLCSSSKYHQFVMTGRISASGNCCGLISQESDITTAYCFWCLFKLCAALTTAPSLPAVVLRSSCYGLMFATCTSLATAPTLPATTLADNCYASMFYGCTSLTAAPELPATSLIASCYGYMFDNCTNLNYIKIGYTGSFGTTYFDSWVQGVSAAGNFYYNGATTTRGTSAIPSGWTIHTF